MFHKIHFIEWKVVWRIYMVRVETKEKTNTSRSDNVWPDVWKYISDTAKCTVKQRRTTEKSKLENVNQLHDIFFIEPDDEEFKHTMKNARRKLEIPIPAAIRKLPWWNCRSIGKHKIKYGCIDDVDKFMRIRLESVQYRNHEDHITAKGISSLDHCNLMHKLIPMPQVSKLPDAKTAVDKEFEKWRKYQHDSWQKSKKKKERIEEVRNKGRKVHFASCSWHEGNSCRLCLPCSKQGVPLHKENHYYEWEKVDNYSRSFTKRRRTGNVDFQSGHDNVASFRSRRTTNWWFKTLGINQISIGEKVCIWRSASFQWRSLVTKDIWRQHQEKNWILQR